MSPDNGGQGLAFHSLAEIFPLIEGPDFDELVADIKTHGLHEPIVLFEEKILDGRNRYRACLAAGIEPAFVPYRGDDPVAYVVSLNLKRRHLSSEHKRELIEKLVKAEPNKSDRAIAEQTKASPTTVGKVRRQLERTGEVSTVDTRRDKKGVRQPAHKPAQLTRAPRRKPAFVPLTSVAWSDASPNERTTLVDAVGLRALYVAAPEDGRTALHNLLATEKKEATV